MPRTNRPYREKEERAEFILFITGVIMIVIVVALAHLTFGLTPIDNQHTVIINKDSTHE